MSQSASVVFVETITKKKVLILYTGGTMGMKKGANGALGCVPGYLTAQIQSNFSEILVDEMPTFTVKEYAKLLDSSCMSCEHWVQIASDIELNYDDYDGFVVIMGTDTMAYASSAVSFMLENLSKPVIFTGSQVPFCEVYSDARRNLIGALIFASRDVFLEVCIFFGDKLLRANRSVKVNSVALTGRYISHIVKFTYYYLCLAFDSPNYPALAVLGSYIEERRELALPHPEKPLPLIVHKELDAKIIVLKLVPGSDDDSILTLVEHARKLKAIVFELYGTGNGPSHKEVLIKAIRLARQKGIVCVAISQCLQGGVSLESVCMYSEDIVIIIITGHDCNYMHIVFHGPGIQECGYY